jgi:hypothetical protein
MNYDEDKIDEYTLALLYLVTHERQEGLGARAWKGFDWETLNRLHQKGYISNPVGKGKSVGMIEEGYLKAKALFKRHFAAKTKTGESTPDVLQRTKGLREQLNKKKVRFTNSADLQRKDRIH